MDKALTCEPKNDENRVIKEIFDMFIAINGKKRYHETECKKGSLL